MSIAAATLFALAPLFVLIVVGYVLKRLHVLHSSHVPILNSLVIKVTLPALIFKGLTSAPVLPLHDALAPLSLFIAQLGVIAAAYIVGAATREPRPTHGALIVTSTFGNTAFLGYPIAMALLPGQFPIAVLLDQFGMTIPLYFVAAFVGLYFAGEAGPRRDLKKNIQHILRSPLFIAVVAAVIFRLMRWPNLVGYAPFVKPLGIIFGQCLTYLGQGTTPVILLALGVSLRPGAAKNYIQPLMWASALKLILCPVLTWLVAKAFGLHGEQRSICILEGAMPTAVVASVLSAQENLAGDFAVAVVFVSTVLSAITVPLVMTVLR